MLRIEPTPQFTCRVVEFGLLETPFVLLDVGARGGIANHWNVFGDRLRVLAVDADPDAEGETFVIAAGRGRRRFYRRVFAAADGLHDTGALFAGTVSEGIVETLAVEDTATVALTDAFRPADLELVDFAKIDVELAEADVLEGSGPLLDSALGVELEVHFPKRPEEAACFAEIDELMRSRGYELYDLDVYRFSRPAWPAPALYDYRNDDGGPLGSGPNTEGQVLTGDALYIRRDLAATHDRLLKLACIFELHRLRDCALELLERSDADVELLDLLRRPHDALRASDGTPWGPNYHIFEELWRQRPAGYRAE